MPNGQTFRDPRPEFLTAIEDQTVGSNFSTLERPIFLMAFASEKCGSQDKRCPRDNNSETALRQTSVIEFHNVFARRHVTGYDG
jgi:hypothetical protein